MSTPPPNIQKCSNYRFNTSIAAKTTSNPLDSSPSTTNANVSGTHLPIASSALFGNTLTTLRAGAHKRTWNAASILSLMKTFIAIGHIFYPESRWRKDLLVFCNELKIKTTLAFSWHTDRKHCRGRLRMSFVGRIVYLESVSVATSGGGENIEKYEHIAQIWRIKKIHEKRKLQGSFLNNQHTTTDLLREVLIFAIMLWIGSHAKVRQSLRWQSCSESPAKSWMHFLPSTAKQRRRCHTGVGKVAGSTS